MHSGASKPSSVSKTYFFYMLSRVLGSKCSQIPFVFILVVHLQVFSQCVWECFNTRRSYFKAEWNLVAFTMLAEYAKIQSYLTALIV